MLANYTLLEKIYEGPSTTVYRAYHTKSNQSFIIKSLDRYSEPTKVAQLHHEYEIVKDLKLINVINIYDLQKSDSGWLLVCEDIHGDSLKNIMAKQKLDLLTFLKIATQLANGLIELHSRHIVHKDLKPANIIVNLGTGRVKITDFSISSRLASENRTLHSFNTLEGTLIYISPEQTGRMNRPIDYRTDFYSLGVVFYEMLVGQPPFQATDVMELVHCHIAKYPPAPLTLNSLIPKTVSNIVMKLLAKTAEERYQSAQGFKADLQKCLVQLESIGYIEDFPCNQHDVIDRLQISHKLYGRQLEVLTLTHAFLRVTQGATEMMVVAGRAGTGKSVLIQEIYKLITQNRGYFISGKFEQLQRNIPYSAVVNAFSDLTQQLLTESSIQLDYWREQLLTALEPNGQIIIDIIPQIELIIGPQPPVQELSPLEAQNRFNWVLKNFVQVFCQPLHPLVIFLDDLQWIDSATLKLIERIMTDTQNQALFLIGAYRDNEVEATHPLKTTLDTLKQAGNVCINEIILNPLTFEHITQLLMETLRISKEKIESLAELIYRKTAGNPFFVNQLLTKLHNDGLLIFKDGSWQWSFENFDVQSLTDNVVSLLIEKLQKFAPDNQTVIKLAACIGNHFNLKTLAIVYEHSLRKTLADLWPAIEESLLLPLDDNYKLFANTEINDVSDSHFKFLHDRVQQAAYMLIEPEQRPHIHLKIGQLLLKNTSTVELEENLFTTLFHLNASLELITDSAERLQLVQLNLDAGKKAKLATAYEPAERYLTLSQHLLPANSWQTHYLLTFEIHKLLTQIHILKGNFQQVGVFYKILLTQAQSVLEKVQVYSLQLEHYQLTGQFTELLAIGNKALVLLGVSIPTQPEMLQNFIFEENQQITLKMRGKTLIEIVELPPVVNLHILTTMQVINNMIMAAFFNGDQLLRGALSMKQTNLSLQYGNSSFSSFGYANLAVFKIVIQHDIQSGIQFGKLAMDSMRQFQDRSMAGRTIHLYYVFLSHWSEPMRHVAKAFETGFRYSVESGDLSFAAFNLVWKVFSPFFCGENLNTIYNEAINVLDYLNKIGSFTAIVVKLAVVQAILHLQGRTHHLETLNTDDFSEEEIFEKFGNVPIIIAWFYGTKVRSLYLFEHYQAVLDLCPQFKWTDILASHQTFHPEIYLYQALAVTAVYPHAPQTQQIDFKQLLDDFLVQMRVWADVYPPNFAFFHLLLQAEVARISGHIIEAMKLYDHAIQMAKENEFTQFEALGNELAAKFWLTQDKTEFAAIYMTKAHHLYNFWGATAKVSDLSKKYPNLLADLTKVDNLQKSVASTLFGMTTAFSMGKSDIFDLSAVIKASQAISKEIILDQLLKKLVQIVVETAGAQSGLLILKEDDQFWIKAEGGAYLQEVNLFEGLPLEIVKDGLIKTTKNTLAPLTLINYVIRTKKDILLDDATQDTLFRTDPYIEREHPKSILCTPIIHQEQIIGLLYLENNLITKAFTVERLTILKLLSTQIAISLQNALLYKKHEQARYEAEAASRAKNVFLANMSHELRTPLNAILGYAQILSFNKNLNPEQREGINVIKRSGDYLLSLINDVLDLSKMEANRLELQASDFNFDKLLKNIQEMFWIRAQQKNIAFIFEQLSPLPKGVHADEKRLRQILTSLIDNAIKFTHRGGVCLKVGYAEMTSPLPLNKQNSAISESLKERATSEPSHLTRKIRFQIEDTGIGIAPEELAKIFQPFKQVDDDKYWTAGMGLGLFMTKKLVEMMGGELHVNSTLGAGSTFWMELELVEIPHFVEKTPEREPIITGYEGARRTILVVDDVLENRLVVANLLEPFGFKVSEAGDGKEGLIKAQTLHPDLILMDFVMPVMDGFEATRRIRKIPELKRTPIIAASASVFDYDRLESIAAGCDAFIAKPFRANVLLELLQKHLQLAWIYQNESKQLAEDTVTSTPVTETLVGPSATEAATLLELATLGDIKGILDYVGKLERLDTALMPFATQIRQLAKEFKEEQICKLVEQYISS